MLIGLTVLAACIPLSRAVLAVSGAGNFSRFTEEGFIILRWVANWKPIEIFLGGNDETRNACGKIDAITPSA